MKIHRRNTYQAGADRTLVDRAWHSSTPLDSVQVGDILRIRNKDTLELVDWRVTELPIKLTEKEAQEEWARLPFGTEENAQRYGYFPYVLRNLDWVEEYPPTLPSPRYIPSEVRVRVWGRDRGRCMSCGSNKELQFDHIIPLSKGGSATEENIEILCGRVTFGRQAGSFDPASPLCQSTASVTGRKRTISITFA